MRPLTAAKKYDVNTTKSIWKKYDILKPYKNDFYCFKTITQILDGHLTRPIRESKNDLYYHKIASPRKQLK